MASTFARLNFNTSIYQTAKPYQCISNDKAKLITYFTWPRGASEKKIKVKSLAHLKVGGWGNVRS